MTSHTSHTLAAATLLASLVAMPVAARQDPASQPAPAERVAAIKQSFAESAAALRQYEWVETTILQLKGEEKSRTQTKCYYGADGKVQKLPVEGAAPKQAESSGRGGRRGGRVVERIVENKKDEITEYMEKAAAMVHAYLPPDPAGIQASKDAGKVTMTPMAAGRAQVVFADFVKPSDALSVDLDLANNRILAIAVKTYVEKPDENVGLTVTFGQLEGGISYQQETVLDAPEKNVKVIIQNSGHRRASRP
jgi:hypothetical protein